MRLKKGFYTRGKKGLIWTVDPVTDQRTSTGCTDPGAAYAWKDERQRIAVDPNYRASHETTISLIAEKLIEQKRRHRSKGTVHFYTKKLGHVLRIFGGDTPIGCVVPDTVDSYITQRLGEGASQNTVSKEFGAIRLLCRVAKRIGCYPGDLDALRPIDFASGYKPRERVLLQGEQDLIEAKNTAEQFATVALFVCTGCRDGEAGRIDPTVDYNAELELVKIRGTKTTGSDRWVPILSMFKPLWDKAAKFMPLKIKDPRQRVRRAAQRAGVPHTTPNDLRRTMATRMLVAGIPYPVAASILGHVDSTMLEQVYGRPTPEQVRAMAEAYMPKQQAFGYCTNSAQVELATCETQCPGTELNRRHVDFQSCVILEKAQKQRANLTLVSPHSPSDNGGSGTSSAQFRAGALAWFRGRRAA